MKTVVGLYDELSHARDVVSDLVDAGFNRNDISLVASDHDSRYSSNLEGRDRRTETGDEAAEGAATGAVAGGVLGGLTGVLLGLGTFAIPGIGPVVAAGPIVAGLTGAGIGAATGGVIGALIGWGIPEEEAEYYAEGVRRGGTLVAVKAEENRVNDAVRIMNQHDPIDVERRAENWRSSGWTGYDPKAESYTTADIQAERQGYQGSNYQSYAPTFRRHHQSSLANTGRDYDAYEPGYRYGYTLATDDRYRDYDEWNQLEPEARRNWERGEHSTKGTWEEFKDSVRHAWEEVKDAFDTDEETRYRREGNVEGREAIPVVEEELRVGKRRTEQGGVRVHAYVEETPAEERVDLRQERVQVERRPVDRPASKADLDAFEEKTFEMTEMSEEAVVDKRARVIEEVVISKDIDTKTETVRDTVRHTRVDVDQLGDQEPFEDDRFRSHYSRNYTNTGYTYNQYQPAYRYGHTLASDRHYRDRDWEDIEPEARRRWEDTNRGTWEEFKDAVRHGWNEVKRGVS